MYAHMRMLILPTLLIAGPAAAQSASTPAGWRALPDSGASVSFDRMPPGWHVTTGSAVLVIHPRATAEGRFSLETEAFLFPGTSAGAYGLLLGGADVEAERRSYVAFLVRRDGSAAVVRRRGGTDTILHAWRKADSLGTHTGDEPVRAVLTVLVEADSVRFRVNGGLVGALARADVAPDGAFGLRVERDVNLHVTRLDLTQRFAPPRGR